MKFLVWISLVFVYDAPTMEALSPTYHQMTINGSNYCLSKTESYTNSEAKTQCTAIGAKLAMFDDNAEFQRVFQTMVGNSTLAVDAWISFNYTITNGVFSFSWKNELFDGNVWIPDGNPNDNCKTRSREKCCAKIRSTDSVGLTDRSCSEASGYLCKVYCSSDGKNCDTTCGNPVICSSGHVRNVTSNTCQDIDECKTGASRCNQTCVNSVGSFKCKCFEGYTLNNDNRTCDDINECILGNSPCQQNCTNSVGSFKCTCFDGFTLKEDNITCVDIDECLNVSSICQQNCTNTNGSFHCSCFDGFTLKEDNITCRDIDECLNGLSVCQQNCTNTVGSFHCNCFDGFLLKEDNRTCVDTDECSKNTSSCKQIYNNTIGSFHCSCEIGYTLSENGVECIKLDECLVSRCERQCQNRSDSCLVDCLQKSPLCDHGCVNHTGTYECTCRPGYSLNTTSETACHDIDECSLNSSLCEVYCNNTPGSYYCSCPQGLQLSEDRYSCVKFTPHSYCPCSCSFNAKKLLMSKEQMTSYLTKLRRSLEVEKSNLLSTRLLVESQMDERPSNTAIGYVGLVFVSIVFGLLILPDCITFVKAVINKIKSFSPKTNSENVVELQLDKINVKY